MSEHGGPVLSPSPAQRKELLDFYRKRYITAFIDAGWDVDDVRLRMRFVDEFIRFLNTDTLPEKPNHDAADMGIYV